MIGLQEPAPPVQTKLQPVSRHSSAALLQQSRKEVAEMMAIKRTATVSQDDVPGEHDPGVGHMIERYVGHAPA